MANNWTCILVDLDGTIADSAPGITASLAHMFEELGRPTPTQEDLMAYIGPPLLDSFRDLAGFTPAESAQALAVYRRHYMEGNSTNGSAIFAGMPKVLKKLYKSGIPLALATSKPEFPASVILDHANLTQYFRVMSGASIDEIRSAKKDVVAEAITRLTMIGADVSNPVMIGDRDYDIQGASEHGIPTIFVDWGYGAVSEQEGALAVVDKPSELLPLLLP